MNKKITVDSVIVKETTVEEMIKQCRVDEFIHHQKPKEIKNYQKDRSNIKLNNNETYFELYYQPLSFGARAAYKCHKCGYNTYYLMEVNKYSKCPNCGRRIVK